MNATEKSGLVFLWLGLSFLIIAVLVEQENMGILAVVFGIVGGALFLFGDDWDKPKENVPDKKRGEK